MVVDPLLQCNTNEAAITAAKAGWGLTRALHYQIAPALAEGALRIVLADHEDSPLPVQLVYPEGRQAAAKVRAFVELAVARLRSDPLLGRGFVG